jgi:hypothetical protein
MSTDCLITADCVITRGVGGKGGGRRGEDGAVGEAGGLDRDLAGADVGLDRLVGAVQWVARIRAGVEVTIRQAVAVTGTRRARYRGLVNTHLEHVYSAVALSLIRLDAHRNDQPLDRHRTSHRARLEQRLQAA